MNAVAGRVRLIVFGERLHSQRMAEFFKSVGGMLQHFGFVFSVFALVMQHRDSVGVDDVAVLRP